MTSDSKKKKKKIIHAHATHPRPLAQVRTYAQNLCQLSDFVVEPRTVLVESFGVSRSTLQYKEEEGDSLAPGDETSFTPFYYL